jgi:phosphotransferase system HPr-like phosphotransfer protein
MGISAETVGAAAGGAAVGYAVGRMGRELRASLRLVRATQGLDCDTTLRSASGTARMPAGGKFPMFSLLGVLNAHGPVIECEAHGPDAGLAHEIISSALRGETTGGFTDEERRLLDGQGRFHQQIIADMPPAASARWLAWLKEDPSRVLPWANKALPSEHESAYPYTQVKGFVPYKDKITVWAALTLEERKKVRNMTFAQSNEFYAAPPDVRRKMLDAIHG